MGFTVYQMDVKSAFLYGTIDEKVYVMQPPGFQDLAFPARVYKVEKAMYGLHQAPRALYGTLSKYLLKNGFQRGTIDQTLFIKRQREDFILVQVYVDDIIFGTSNPQLCREFKALMHKKFQMSAMGELNFFLGLQVLQKKDGIFLSQDKYIGDILKKFRFLDVRSLNTPMDKENPWGKDGIGKDVKLHLYRSMIGSLMYLTASRPDIMFVVCACARHQVTPKECHLHAVKRIFRYLKGHPKLGLWYPKASPFDLGHPKLGIWYPKASPFDLVAFSDSDYGGASQDPTSTIEAEYVAAASCCGQVLWIQNQLLDYRHHFIRDYFEKKLISVDHIPTDENVADLLTKAFDARRFQYLVSSTLPRDSAPRVTSPAAEEGSMQQTLNELTAFCTSLQRKHSELLAKFQAQEVEINRLKERVKNLEDKDGVIGDTSGDDAPIKGRSTNEGEALAERISTNSEEIARVLTFMDAATVLARETNVPTGSGSIPTTGPPATIVTTGSEVGPTASPIVRRRKGKEIMVESDTPKKKKLQEQIDAQMARELEEQQEKEDLRMNE
nr:hypothetical protein [Tanacetum cinerariifolium]